MDVDEALAIADRSGAGLVTGLVARVLADEVREWRRVGAMMLHTHRSGDVVLIQEDADAIERLLEGDR